MTGHLPPQPVFFVHAAGDPRHPDGSGRLVGHLAKELGADYRVIAPVMPDADNPSYAPWRDAIARELATIEGSVILVGHSFGASVLLKYLAEGSFAGPIPGLFLVAMPDWGPQGWAYEDFGVPDDVAGRLAGTPVFLYHSLDDPEVPYAHLRLNEAKLPGATSRSIAGTQHSFTDGLPELVRDIKGVVH